MLLIHKHIGDWRARTFRYYQHLSKDQNAKYGTVRMASINYQSKIRYENYHRTFELFVIKYKMQSSYFIWTQSDELLQETLIKDSKLQNIKSNPHFLWTVDWRQ